MVQHPVQIRVLRDVVQVLHHLGEAVESRAQVVLQLVPGLGADGAGVLILVHGLVNDLVQVHQRGQQVLQVGPQLGGVGELDVVLQQVKGLLHLVCGGLQIAARGLQLGAEVPQLPKNGVVVLLNAVQCVQHVPGAVQQGHQLVGPIPHRLGDGHGLVHIPVDHQGQGVDGVDVGVGKVAELPVQVVGALPGAVRLLGDTGDAGGHRVRGGLGIVQRAVDEALEGVQLGPQVLQLVGGQLEGHIRGHLAYDAAHILAALDGAAVGAVGDIAVLPAHYAAHVVAHVGIAHVAQIGAGLDHTGGIAGDAAGVGGDGGLGHAVVLQQSVEGALQPGQLGRADGLLADIGVDPRGVGAAEDGARVLADHAAGIVGAPDNTGGCAAADGAAGGVAPGDAAHPVVGGDKAGEGAVLNGAAVLSGDTAHAALAAVGVHLALHPEVPDHSPGLHLTEQAVAGGAALQRKAADAVAAALKGSQKDGHGHRGPAQINVIGQIDRQALGIGVGGAAGGKVQQLIPGGKGDGALRRRGRRDQGEGQRERQQPGRAPAQQSVIPLHVRSPPLWWSQLRVLLLYRPAAGPAAPPRCRTRCSGPRCHRYWRASRR